MNNPMSKLYEIKKIIRYLLSKLYEIKKIIRYLFGRCSYCGGMLRNGGGKGFGTLHTVFESPSPTSKEIKKYSCLKCEMGFDED